MWSRGTFEIEGERWPFASKGGHLVGNQREWMLIRGAGRVGQSFFACWNRGSMHIWGQRRLETQEEPE